MANEPPRTGLHEVFPRRRQRLYEALRDAGVPAIPQRNVP
jgi:hypothetical protein